MRQSLLYFVAAGLFAIATSLNFFNDGFNLMTVLGAVMAGVLLTLGLRVQRAGSYRPGRNEATLAPSASTA